MKLTRFFAWLPAALVLTMAVGVDVAHANPPNPILYLTHMEPYTINGTTFMRYNYDVFNKDQYPAAMFTAAPALPPCGSNHNSSRSWVDFFDQAGHRLYGFCALGTPNNLGSIWFALPVDQVPPSYVYIKIIDRQTNTTYTSNLADTVM